MASTLLNVSRLNVSSVLRQIKISKLSISRPVVAGLSSKSDQPTKESGRDDAGEKESPVRYTTSKAHEHSPFDTFLYKNKFPWYQPAVVLVSTSVFLIYFCVLREENDIDDELSRSLYEKIPGLEEKSIQGQINSAKQLGKDTSFLEKHLRDVRASTASSQK